MKHTYDLFEGDDLVIAEKILQRRLQMLVHSCIYYNMDNNIVSDKTWTEWALELAELQNKYPEISKQIDWYEAFKDWDGSTGAFLPLDDKWVVEKASLLLNGRARKPNKKKEK